MVNTKIRFIIFFAAKDGEALYSQQKQDQEVTGSDHELLIAKFRLKLKKVRKAIRPSFIILILKNEKTLIPYTKAGNLMQY